MLVRANIVLKRIINNCINYPPGASDQDIMSSEKSDRIYSKSIKE